MRIILAYSYLSVVYSTPLMESHILARRPKSSYFNLKKNTNSSIYAVEFRDKSLNKVNCNLIQILISLTLMCRKLGRSGLFPWPIRERNVPAVRVAGLSTVILQHAFRTAVLL